MKISRNFVCSSYRYVGGAAVQCNIVNTGSMVHTSSALNKHSGSFFAFSLGGGWLEVYGGGVDRININTGLS